MNTLNAINTLLFDLDGTLFSTRKILCVSYQSAVSEFCKRFPRLLNKTPECEEIYPLIGLPSRVIVKTLFPDLTPHLVSELSALILQELLVRIRGKEGALFQDVRETLEALCASYRLCIASNGVKDYVCAVLETYDLVKLFQPVVAIDSSSIVDKQGILAAYQHAYNFLPSQAVMIGDRLVDWQSAQAVGFHFIGCTYGFAYGDELCGAPLLIDSFNDLRRVFLPQSSI